MCKNYILIFLTLLAESHLKVATKNDEHRNFRNLRL